MLLCRHSIPDMQPYSHRHYEGFTEAGLIADPFFQDWIIHPDAEKDRFWEEFLQRYPQQAAVIQQAKTFLQNLSFTQYVPDETTIQQSLALHLARIDALEETPAPVRTLRQWYGVAFRIAAVLAGVVLLTLLIFFQYDQRKPKTVQTAYGQLRTVLLPDSSSIVLNAHSSLRFSGQWQSGQVREVWLEGEAFFNVRHLNRDPAHISEHERFLVHAGGLDVEVLGTQFDIRQRRGKTEVVLQSGRVKVTVRPRVSPDLILQPGDVVTYQSAEDRLLRSTTAARDYSAWKEKKLILTNPTVTEIAAYLEDTYGQKILLQDPKMGSRIIDGPILLNNLDDALFILTTVLHANIIKHDSTLIVQPK